MLLPLLNPHTSIAAQARIAADVRRTPLLRLPGAALSVACAERWLKLKHLKPGGSLKAAACSAACGSGRSAAGVLISPGSSGGIAAAAARALDVRCKVFSPEVVKDAKRQALAALNAQGVVVGAAMPTRWPPAWRGSRSRARC